MNDALRSGKPRRALPRGAVPWRCLPRGSVLPRHASVVTWLCAVALGCAAQPAKSPDVAGEAAELSVAEASAAPVPTEAPASADTAAVAPSAAPAARNTELDQDIANIEKMAGLRPAEAQAPSGREIVYRVSSGELTIEIDRGLVLKPKAKAVQRAGGAYGVEIEIGAESKDGQQYWITSPGSRPLSIAGEVVVRTDETRRFGDERKGEGEILVPASGTRRFRQSWPAKGQPKLWGGQKATLEVGLWGMHGDDERERPVKRLFIVKLSASGRPTALIMPPDVVSSE